MTEANFYQCGEALDYTPDADVLGGEVRQMSDGRAGVVPVDVKSGIKGAIQTEGVYLIAKTTSMVFLDGGKVFWDHSANKAHFKAVLTRGQMAQQEAEALKERESVFKRTVRGFATG